MRVFWMWLMLGVCQGAFADDVVKLIQLNYKTVSDMMPLLTPALADGAKLSGQGKTLVIKTTSKNLTQLRYLIHRIDVPPTQFLIAIRQGNRHGNTTNLGNVIEYNTQSDDYQLRRQWVKVQSGEKAFVSTAKEVPMISSVGIGLWTGVDVERRRIQQGFWIEPERQGSQVLLKIYRLRERLTRVSNQQVLSQTSMTQLRVPLNRWVALGSSRSQGGLDTPDTIVYQTGDRFRQTSEYYVKVSIVDSLDSLAPTK